MESMFALDLAHAVLAAELDLAIITEPSENKLLTSVPIATAPLCVAMPADLPAARQTSVSMRDLGSFGWMIFSRKTHPKIYDQVLMAGQQVGISPKELHHYVNPPEVTQLINENFGVAFVAQGVSHSLKSRDIAIRPLSESSLQLTSHLVLRADQSSRLVNDFGRAFLKKVVPNAKIVDSNGQLLLKL
jgi:DNA-binding transcriptional LysR family regulator